jgi:hypothetical protein
LAPVNAVEEGVPDVPGPMMRRIKLEHCLRLCTPGVFINQQFDTLCMAAEDGEVEAIATVIHPQREGARGTYSERP